MPSARTGRPTGKADRFRELDPAKVAGCWRDVMRHYGESAQRSVERAMRKRKNGTLQSGRSHKRVTDRSQAIAIGLEEARKKGAKVPARSRRKTSRTSRSTRSER